MQWENLKFKLETSPQKRNICFFWERRETSVCMAGSSLCIGRWPSMQRLLQVLSCRDRQLFQYCKSQSCARDLKYVESADRLGQKAGALRSTTSSTLFLTWWCRGCVSHTMGQKSSQQLHEQLQVHWLWKDLRSESNTLMLYVFRPLHQNDFWRHSRSLWSKTQVRIQDWGQGSLDSEIWILTLGSTNPHTLTPAGFRLLVNGTRPRTYICGL